MQKKYKIGIVTHANDFHALAVRAELEKRNNIQCHIFLSDQISGRKSISWQLNESLNSYLLNSDRKKINLDHLNIIWWRRAAQKQRITSKNIYPSYIDLIENDCRAAFTGVFHSTYQGKWVNDPIKTTLAENKLFQLKIAKDCGFRVPETLISQDKKEILGFCKKLKYNVVLKPVKGTTQVPLFTMKVKPAHLRSEKNLLLCPSIFQEYIDGDEHLRINVFGKKIFAFRLTSKNLDWRKNIDIPFELCQLSKDFNSKLIKTMGSLGLKMGIFDFKLTDKGEIVWLEINPQGQFLFLEGSTGVKLLEPFCEFLCKEATG